MPGVGDAEDLGDGALTVQHQPVHRLARNRFTRQRRETGKGAYDVEMKELGFTPGVELVEVGPVTPPDKIVKRLQLEPGEQALIRRRRMYANDEPMQLATSYIPWSLAEGTPMAERDTGPGGRPPAAAVLGRQHHGGRRGADLTLLASWEPIRQVGASSFLP